MNIPNCIAHYRYPKFHTIGNVFIVSSFDFTQKEIIQKAVQGMSYSFINEEEVKTGADVFPLHFFLIKYLGNCVWGTDILSTLTIHNTHLRTALEYELKNKSIQLRGDFICYPIEQIITNILPTLSSFLPILSFLACQKYSDDAIKNAEYLEIYLPNTLSLITTLSEKKYTENTEYDTLIKTEKWLSEATKYVNNLSF